MKHIFKSCLVFLVLGLCTSALAYPSYASPFTDEVSLSAGTSSPDSVIMVWRSDSVLYLRFPLTADMSRRYCSNYRVTATPMVCDTAGNSILLNSTVFAGKKNLKFTTRLFRLGIIDTLYSTHNVKDTVIYDTLLVVPDSMRTSCPSLYVDRLEEGCSRSNLMPTDFVASAKCAFPEPKVDTVDAEIIKQLPADLPKPIIPIIRPTPANDYSDTNDKPDSTMVAAIVPIESYQPFDESIPLTSDHAAAYVAFRFDNAQIDTVYNHNDFNLSVIFEMIDLLIADPQCEVAKIRLIGATSIEGDADYNKRLSMTRVKALHKVIKQHYTGMDFDCELIAVGEAWADFRKDIAETDSALLPAKQYILHIIDKTDNLAERERRIKAEIDAVSWKYILRNIFKRQRVAGFVKVYYRKK